MRASVFNPAEQPLDLIGIGPGAVPDAALDAGWSPMNCAVCITALKHLVELHRLDQ